LHQPLDALKGMQYYNFAIFQPNAKSNNYSTGSFNDWQL